MSKTILVTGGNKSLGLESVGLLTRRYPQGTILLGTRSVENGHKGIDSLKSRGYDTDRVRAVQLDVTDPASVDSVVELIKKEYEGKLQALYSNAAVAHFQPGYESAKDTMKVNYYGLRRINEAVLPLLKANGGGHIVIVSSEVGSWGHNGSPESLRKIIDHPDQMTVQQVDDIVERYVESQKKGNEEIAKNEFPPPEASFGAYGVSKVLVSTYGRIFARQVKDQGVVVALVCPGYCKTDLNHHQGFRTALVGARSILYGEEFGLDQSGGFWQDGKPMPMASPMADMEKYKKEAEETNDKLEREAQNFGKPGVKV